MDNISEQLISGNPEQRVSLLKQLQTRCRESGGMLMVANPSKFFGSVRELLSSSSPEEESQKLLLELLQELIPEFGPDLESCFSSLLSPLVLALSDQRFSRSALSVLKSYIKATRNVESVIDSLCKSGLQSSDWRLKMQCLQNVISLIQLDLSFTANVLEMKKLTENVLTLTKDSSTKVSECASQVAHQLKALTYDFRLVFARLSFSHQQIFRDMNEDEHSSIQSFSVYQDSSDKMRFSKQNFSKYNNNVDINRPSKQHFNPFDIYSEESKPTKQFRISNEFADEMYGKHKPKMFNEFTDVKPKPNKFLDFPEETRLSKRNQSFNIFKDFSEQPSKRKMNYFEDQEDRFSLDPSFSKNPAHGKNAYGIVPSALMSALESENWKARVNAVQELESLVLSSSSAQTLRPHMRMFLQFVSKFIPDHNFKIVQSTLNIIKNIAREAGPDLEVIVPGCLKKLDDNRITIRQAVFQVFKELIQVLSPNLLFPKLIDALGSSSWHVREEVTNIMIAAMLTAKENYSFSFIGLVPALAKLLDDPKTKIKYVATEALAVCANRCGGKNVLNALRPIVDPPALRSLEERFKNEQLPKVRDDFIEFPKTVPSSAPAISSPYISAQNFGPQTPATQTDKLIKTDYTHKKPPIKLNYNDKGSNMLKSVWKFSPSRTESVKPQQSSEKIPRRTPQVEPKRKELGGFSSASFLESSPAKSNLGSDQNSYMHKEDIQPLSNPESVLESCLSAGESDDWSTQFNTLNSLRQLFKFHASTISSSSLHLICLNVLKWADSLRSSLSKNALIVIGEICQYVGKSLDNDLSLIIRTLMKKAVDTNTFISEEASSSLQSLCKHCNEHKALQCLLSLNNRNPIIKAKICMCFSILLSKQIRFKEMDQIVKMLGGFITDASVNVREGAKKAFQVLQKYEEFDQLTLTLLNQSTLKKLKEMLKKPGSKPEVPKKTSMRVTERKEIPELDNIQKIAVDLENSAWKVREDALGELLGYVTSYSSAIKQSSKLITVIDVLCKAMGDQNLKVHIHALNSMLKIIPLLGKALEPHLGNLTNALLPSIGSSNSSIREMARQVIAMLTANCEKHVLLPAFTAAFPHGNPRSKAAILQTISDIVPDVAEKKPGVVQKHAVPLAFKVMDDRKKECFEQLADLLLALYDHLGSKFLELIPQDKMEDVIDILNEKL